MLAFVENVLVVSQFVHIGCIGKHVGGTADLHFVMQSHQLQHIITTLHRARLLRYMARTHAHVQRTCACDCPRARMIDARKCQEFGCSVSVCFHHRLLEFYAGSTFAILVL